MPLVQRGCTSLQVNDVVKRSVGIGSKIQNQAPRFGVYIWPLNRWHILCNVWFRNPVVPMHIHNFDMWRWSRAYFDLGGSGHGYVVVDISNHATLLCSLTCRCTYILSIYPMRMTFQLASFNLDIPHWKYWCKHPSKHVFKLLQRGRLAGLTQWCDTMMFT